MNKTVLVFGGTGHLGRELVEELLECGYSTRVASRRDRSPLTDERLEWVRTDLATGEGIALSVDGVNTIIFCAGDPKKHAAVEVDGLRRLLGAARNAGVAHFIFVSIVGIASLPVAYYRTKLDAESVIQDSGVPHTILRATQFHYFVDLLLGTLARVPFLMPVPRHFSVQPVDILDVADRLMRCLAEGPRGMLNDFAGPEILDAREAAVRWQQARGMDKPIFEIPIPGKLGRAFRKGLNTSRSADKGTRRWSDWLANTYGLAQSRVDKKSEAEPVLELCG